jgi:NADPH:quinone reductase-like Zn-dependent oxidoreductase
MKAVYYNQYGKPDVLTLRDLPAPTPKADEVLVKVHAVSINSWDWDMVRGEPWIVRMWGLTGPRNKVPGADIAGVVVGTGSNVKRFKPGDEVFGDLCECNWGGLAEYKSVNENALALKPAALSMEQAAALPQAGLMAMQSMKQGRAGKGSKVLMNGAGGGVGTYVIQLARSLGAEVTAVDSASKLDALGRLGADHVIDCEKEDFTASGIPYDIIIDVVASRPTHHYERVLSPNGSLVIVGGTMGVLFGSIIQRWLRSSRNGRHLGMMPYRVNDGLVTLASLCVEGTIKPVIDSIYPMAAAREAFERFASGAFIGKIIIKLV